MTQGTGNVGLETPVASAKPKGLVPRSAIWLLVIVLFTGLIGYAVYDILKETKRQKEAAARAPSTALGGPPSPDALAKLVAEQGGTQNPIEAAVPSGRAASGPRALAIDKPDKSAQPIVPPEVVAGAGQQSPSKGLELPRVPQQEDDKAAAKALAAHAELMARIATSSLVAIDGKTPREARSDATGASQRDPGAGGDATAITGGAPGMPSIESIIKAVTSGAGGARGAQAQPGQNPATRDTAWVREAADARPAPVTYASAPPSSNLLLQGSRIPAVTLEAVNSDMPGQITARATEDMRDSLSQRTVLVPKGTRFVGSYNAEVSPGQTRVLMAFNRMILPDGRSVELHASQATDAIGQSGITGDVDNHFLKMYAYSLAVAIAGERVGNKGVVSSSSVAGPQGTKTIAGEVLADVSRRILDRNSNIPPTITTPVGERIYITITRDIALAPWKVQYE